jgi:hypothetical protein
MSTELRAAKEISQATKNSKRAATAPVKKERLPEVVAAVLKDSQKRPGEYLDEVVVLKGGE